MDPTTPRQEGLRVSPEAPTPSPDPNGATRLSAVSEGAGRSRLRAAAITAELRAQGELGRDLARRGEDVELHGTVVNGAGGRVLAAYALVGGLAALGGALWPKQCVVVLLAVLLAGWCDLEQGCSWLRRFVPRDIGRTVVVWRARQGLPGPGPGAPSSHPGRRVLVCLPADLSRVRVVAAWSWLPVAGALLVALVGAALGSVGADGRTLQLAAAAAFAVVFFAGLFFDRMVTGSVEPSSGADLLHSLLASLEARPLEHLDLCVAVVGGGSLFFDGVAVLLKNHSNRLPRGQTHVLSWAPGAGPLAAACKEGRVRSRPAPPLMLDLARTLGTPEVRGTTAAGRAQRLGWSALGLVGGQGDPASVHRTLLASLRGLDAEAADA